VYTIYLHAGSSSEAVFEGLYNGGVLFIALHTVSYYLD
jgi:hypothetical protein